jgi:ADP-heptose:LPS heptosyltransferase
MRGVRRLRGRPRGNRRAVTARRPTVVALRALGLGDFLTAVPAYRGLRRHHPGHEIVLAAPAPLAPLATWTGAIDRVLPTGELAPVPWSGPPADLAVNLHGRGPQSHRVLAAVPAARRVGFGCTGAAFDGPAWQDGEHEVRRWCRLLGAAGIGCDPADLLLTLPAGTPAPDRPPVLLHPGAAAAARRWPPDRFAAVARALAADGWPVAVTGTAAERPLALLVAGLAGLPDGAVLAGRTGLRGLARTVAGAALVVCGDTGVGHLATATGTPSVLLFGPVPPARWGPLRDQDRHVVLWSGRAGDPHGTAVDPGLLGITAAEALAAARALLAAPSAVDATRG